MVILRLQMKLIEFISYADSIKYTLKDKLHTHEYIWKKRNYFRVIYAVQIISLVPYVAVRTQMELRSTKRQPPGLSQVSIIHPCSNSDHELYQVKDLFYSVSRNLPFSYVFPHGYHNLIGKFYSEHT